MFQRKAFTLIELLVVIAIIAVIISILLPSLAKARELSRQAKCSINLKSFAQATIAYEHQYNTYPVVPGFPDPNIGQFDLKDALEAYIDLPEPSRQIALDPWVCPSDKDSIFPPTFGTTYLYAVASVRQIYEINGTFSNLGVFKHVPFMTVYRENAHRKVQLHQEGTTIHPGHGQNTNASFPDGHAEFYKRTLTPLEIY